MLRLLNLAPGDGGNILNRLVSTILLLLTATPALPAVGTGHLYELIDARLELMDEVAAYKWRQDRPIEDPEREALVLDRAVDDALRHGFTPDSSRAFFAAQIEAAKQIQRHWFRIWEAGEGPGVPTASSRGCPAGGDDRAMTEWACRTRRT